jgi:hypothetical protein
MPVLEDDVNDPNEALDGDFASLSRSKFEDESDRLASDSIGGSDCANIGVDFCRSKNCGGIDIGNDNNAFLADDNDIPTS